MSGEGRVAAPAGFLIIDKPSGVTSFAMVSLVRRLTGVRRVGHAGTLDPLASGVLPMAIGPATRLIEYLDDTPKVYLARVRFGVSTDTYDAEGAITSERDASSVTREAVERLLPSFTGDIVQRPPRYSALKVAGKPLYRYAREGADVEAAPRRVRVERIAVRSFGGGEAEIEVTCGKGTYIRSLAHDLGEKLSCGAHLTALRRTASGGFTDADVHTPDDLRAAADAGVLTELLLAPDRAVERRPAAILDAQHAADVRAGRDIVARPRREADRCRAYGADGVFLGVLAHAGEGRWHPEKMLVRASLGRI